jgi:hypothetical protein
MYESGDELDIRSAEDVEAEETRYSTSNRRNRKRHPCSRGRRRTTPARGLPSLAPGKK